MKWIYEDYDRDQRLKNIMWTVSGDYEQDLESFEKYSDLSKDLAVYYAAKAGARRKYMDWKLIKGYLNYRLRRTKANAQLLVGITEVCTDQAVERKLLKERPGMEEIRESGYEALMENFLLSKNKDLIDKVKYLIFFRQTGKSVQMDKKVVDVVNDIESQNDFKDTMDVIRKIEQVYVDHFEGEAADIDFIEEDDKARETIEHFSEADFEEESMNDFMQEEYYGEQEDLSEAVDRMANHLMVESMGEMKKEEQENTSEKTISIDEETAEKIQDKIAHYYGQSYLPKEKVKSIEKKVCRSVHEGCRVHFTDGVLRTSTDNNFQVKYVQKQLEKNVAFYNNNSRVHKRNIFKLKEQLIKTLAMEQETSYLPSEYGQIVPQRLWKVEHTDDTRLFNRILKNEKGGYAVDVLLDASGSQKNRQGSVASQGYIISQALTLAQIPNRVMSFSSFLDFTILRRFRDYDSPIEENKNIFEYYATGNNRDGLAIRAVCEALIQRQEDNKILIILSDGKPNDMKIAKGSTIRGEASYRGIKAIKDTAKEVRAARKNGVLVLGVFTGKEEELYAEKYIYGKDFIYNRNIERFSDIVGTFLKRIIENY
ncbi:MAG TPA: nitric oxide reductase activation-like protein [Eubacteriaceae bacterium]|nr:nitric oxide reductase activation-like protein [Eubacteriaceae bacterium]